MTRERAFKRPKMRRHPRLIVRRFLRSWPFFVWLGVAVGTAWLYTRSVQFGGMTGVVEAIAEDVAPLETARLQAVDVVVGQEVKAGVVVARMDTALLDARIAIDDARIAEAQGEVSGYQQDLLRLANNMDTAILDAEFELENVRIQQARDEAELAELDAELKRREKLLTQRLLNEQDVAELRPPVAALKSTVASYPSLLKVHEERLAEARRERRRLTVWLYGADSAAVSSNSMDDVAHAVERWRQWQETIFAKSQERRQRQLDTYTLKAAISGVVSRINHAPGEVVPSGEPVLRIVQRTSDTIVGFLPEDYIHDVGVGDSVLVWRSNGGSRKRTATVESISPDVQGLPGRINPMRPVRGRRVIMRMADSRGMIPGETVQVNLRESGWIDTVTNFLPGGGGKGDTGEGDTGK